MCDCFPPPKVATIRTKKSNKANKPQPNPDQPSCTSKIFFFDTCHAVIVWRKYTVYHRVIIPFHSLDYCTTPLEQSTPAPSLHRWALSSKICKKYKFGTRYERERIGQRDQNVGVKTHTRCSGTLMCPCVGQSGHSTDSLIVPHRAMRLYWLETRFSSQLLCCCGEVAASSAVKGHFGNKKKKKQSWVPGRISTSVPLQQRVLLGGTF